LLYMDTCHGYGCVMECHSIMRMGMYGCAFDTGHITVRIRIPVPSITAPHYRYSTFVGSCIKYSTVSNALIFIETQLCYNRKESSIPIPCWMRQPWHCSYFQRDKTRRMSCNTQYYSLSILLSSWNTRVYFTRTIRSIASLQAGARHVNILYQRNAYLCWNLEHTNKPTMATP
jgi:hypothetical protein